MSKGFHAINRFSEDIDITFDEHIGEGKRKRLKNITLAGISDTLKMPISNWSETRSGRDYNAYMFTYMSVLGIEDDRMLQNVKMETALGSYAFPTDIVSIGSYIGDYLREKGRADLAEQYSLGLFSMKLQSLERTYIDKIFALCDYYINRNVKRYSRHLYDIYKLTPMISLGDQFSKLFTEVRNHRAKMTICPSAQPDINVATIINEFCDTEFCKDDYQTITNYFADDTVKYEDTIHQMRLLSKLDIIAHSKD